jgi:hypothetical protein
MINKILVNNMVHYIHAKQSYLFKLRDLRVKRAGRGSNGLSVGTDRGGSLLCLEIFDLGGKLTGVTPLETKVSSIYRRSKEEEHDGRMHERENLALDDTILAALCKSSRAIKDQRGKEGRETHNSLGNKILGGVFRLGRGLDNSNAASNRASDAGRGSERTHSAEAQAGAHHGARHSSKLKM